MDLMKACTKEKMEGDKDLNSATEWASDEARELV
jgi:hypothetical protein